MDYQAFVQRVVKHLPKGDPKTFTFSHWPHAGRPTEEAFGIMPIAGVDPTKVMDAVMDVDHYKGNITHVAACRAIADPRFEFPEHVRFYQRVEIALLGAIHNELVLHRLGEMEGYEVTAWELLRSETDALSKRDGLRSEYNQGAWFAKPGILGYALATCPKRGDVGRLKWVAMTRGANATASRILQTNLEAMATWAARRA